jgi:hypothetical protein
LEKAFREISEEHYSDKPGYLEIERVYLPSPSAAYARVSLEQKAKIYKEELL